MRRVLSTKQWLGGIQTKFQMPAASHSSRQASRQCRKRANKHQIAYRSFQIAWDKTSASLEVVRVDKILYRTGLKRRGWTLQWIHLTNFSDSSAYPSKDSSKGQILQAARSFPRSRARGVHSQWRSPTVLSTELTPSVRCSTATFMRYLG